MLRSAGFSPFRCAAVGDARALVVGGNEPMEVFQKQFQGVCSLDKQKAPSSLLYRCHGMAQETSVLEQH